MKKILVNLHGGEIVSVCDADLIGKSFDEEELHLEVNERFYNGIEMGAEEIIDILKQANNANIVGEESVNMALKAKIISEEGIRYVQNIPIACIFSL